MKNKTAIFARSLLLPTLLFTLNAHLATAHAQGTAFTYQGQLLNNGSPANGSYDLTFALFNTNASGVAIAGSVTNNAVSVTNGLFTTMIDFGPGVFTGATNWLQIGVATNGVSSFTPLSPRQQLTPTPYATFANTAANLSGTLPAAQISGTVSSANLSGTYGNAVTLNNAGNSFSGNGSGLTGLNAASLTGTLPVASLPATVVTNTETGVTLGGTFNGTFSGNGAGVTNVGLGTLNAPGLFSWGNFITASSPGVGILPQSVVAVDVNGDGKLDLISANAGANTLTVLTNNGSGGFGSNATLTAGSSPRAVVAADINGDGKLDLISANYNDNTLTVLTNNGSGGFGLASSPGVGSGPYSVVAADVNGDGKLDLISANYNDNTLTVLTNNGSGGFGLASSPVVGSHPVSVVAADVNGDGKLDLISANINANTLTVLTNNGSGGFGSNATLNVGSSPASVVAADVNEDGKLDLISANAGANTLTVLFNTPIIRGTFSGNGSGLTSLNASQLASGTVADAFLSSNVAFDNGNNFFTGVNTFVNAFNVFTGISFTGNGSGLTSLNAANLTGSVPSSALNSVPAASLTGTLPLALLPATVVTNTETGVTLGGTFSGNGSGLTNLNTAQFANSVLTNGETGLTLGGTFSGNGGGLTNLNASQLNGAVPSASLTSVPAASLTGTVPATSLPASVVTNTETGVTLGGTFSGNGGGLTNLNAAQLTSIGNYNFFLGSPVGNSSTTGNSEIGIGSYALVSDSSGSVNIAIGPQALLNNSSGSDNTAIGYTALQNNISGNYNTAISPGALFNTTGGNNIALGYQAGYNLTTGSSNIDIGNVGVAGENNVTRIGTSQTQAFIAGTISGNGGGLTNLNAAQLTSIGNYNFFLGSPVGNSSTTGNSEIGIGSYALVSDSSGSVNIAIGPQALLNNSSGSDNTAIGYTALQNNISGNYNTAISPGALFNTTGGNNIALGYQAGYNLTTGSSNIDIGNMGLTLDTNIIRIGTSQTTTYLAGVINGNGGGLTNLNAAQLSGAVPSATLTSVPAANLTGALPGISGASLTSLPANAALLGASQNFTGGNTFTSTMTVTNSGAVNSLNVYGTQTGGWPNPVALFENKSTAATASPALRLLCDGGANMDGALSVSVSTGTTGLIAEFGNSTAFVVRITNNGSIYAAGNVYANGVLLTSDRNTKEHFQPVDNQAVLAKVAALPVTQWNYKQDQADVQHIGPMAQDFQAAFQLDGGDEKHISVVDEGGVALAAIQGLNQKLEADAKAKDAEIESLKQSLAELKQMVQTLAEKK